MRKLVLFFVAVGSLCAKESFAFRHREASGVGYNSGYSTADFFGGPKLERPLQPFFNARAHMMNDGQFASNVGVGGRLQPSPGRSLTLGANLYHDYRAGAHQVGLGLESLSRRIDFRLNSYVPIKAERGEELFSNVQGEIGAPIPGFFKRVALYLAAGPYNLMSKEASHLGVQGRASFQLFGNMKGGIYATYDSVFRGTLQAYVSISYPVGRVKKTVARIMQPVQRFEMIPMKVKAITQKAAAPWVEFVKGYIPAEIPELTVDSSTVLGFLSKAKPVLNFLNPLGEVEAVQNLSYQEIAHVQLPVVNFHPELLQSHFLLSGSRLTYIER